MKEIKRVYEDEAYRWQDGGNKYAVRFVRDEFPEDPRSWYNAGKMYCWHRHYKLGDSNPYGDPEDMWRALVRKNVSNGELFNALMSGDLCGIRAEKVEKCGCTLFNIYETVEYRTAFSRSEPEEELAYEEIQEASISEWIIDDLTIGHCMELLKEHVAWLGLSIYDHGGITMSYNQGSYPYNDRWDSSVVGWIIIDKETALKELVGIVRDENGKEVMVEIKHPGEPSTFGVKTYELTDEDWKYRAVEVMKSEVEQYDKYLTGEVLGFEVYELSGDSEDDETWDMVGSLFGFYGTDTEESGILGEIGYGFSKALKEDRVSESEYEEEKIVTVTHKFS